ncbi:acyl carrier protein [Pseudonocardia xinjiangensis]|uniref:acyl carrier protein n=1 Tax=Pseudonocardia xinjiangensis TaxID=75289 RepID=UPI003D8A4A51
MATAHGPGHCSAGGRRPAAATLASDPAGFAEHGNLQEQGFTSLTAMELATALQAATDLEVAPVAV